MSSFAAALDRGNKNAAKVAINNLNALINQVRGADGQKITAEVSEVLIFKANAIIATLVG